MKKKMSMKTAIPMMAVILIILIVLKACGLLTFRTGTRIGFAGNDGVHVFSGSYLKISGTMTHTLKPSKDSVNIHCEVTTKEGILHVTVTRQKDSNVIFDRDIRGDENFDIPAEGKVNVKISTEEHSGSYRFEY